MTALRAYDHLALPAPAGVIGGAAAVIGWLRETLSS